MELDRGRKLEIIDVANIFCETAHEAADIEWKSEQELIKYLLSDHIPKSSHHIFMSYFKAK